MKTLKNLEASRDLRHLCHTHSYPMCGLLSPDATLGMYFRDCVIYYSLVDQSANTYMYSRALYALCFICK